MKVLIKAVVKEAVKSDVGSKAHWIKKIGRVCLGCKCHMVMGGKGMVLAEKGRLTMKAIVNTLGRHLFVMVLLSC